MIRNSDQPILSVIVPVFNTEAYLQRCIDSIVNQSLQKIEILFVNDQSTDNSESIILANKELNKSIHYFKTETRSLAGGARNIGLAHARGKYIGFVDSDDWIDSNMFERAIWSLETSKADIAVCGVTKEYEASYDYYKKYVYEFENIIEGSFAFNILTGTINQDIAISPIACNKIYRSEFIRYHSFRFPVNNYNEDDVFNYLCFANVKQVAIISNAYYHYYQRENSITHSFSTKHIDDLFDAFEMVKSYLDKNGNFAAHRKNYFSFFERCAGFILNLLLTKEPDIKIQNQYLERFINRAKSVELVGDYLQYCGVKRLRFFINPVIIK